MTYPDLPEVGVRLEEAVERLAAARPSDDLLQLYEEAAIGMLDSEHADYPEGSLARLPDEFPAPTQPITFPTETLDTMPGFLIYMEQQL